ncbi:chromatin associated protein KTI12 [Aureobasidium sp. EXF-3400]|nr:chromatin associated protein KTI12 [Aureobasidium sp. EXF-3400]
MPLILISGFPSSGKTHRSEQLKEYFAQRISESEDPRIAKLKIHHLNDQNLGLDRDVYAAARSEKDARATLSSAIKRDLTANSIVIADSMNYIKGFRYQMFCEAKAQRTPSCVVHIGTPVEKCRQLNQLALDAGTGGYAPELFENLVFRYEEPNGMTRWDSPLYTVPFDDSAPPLEELWDTLVGGKVKAVKPNSATVLAPATEQNYLYELDKTTSDIVAQISGWQKDHPGESGGEVVVQGAENVIELPANAIGLPQLQRLRRQFITMNRTHSLTKDRIKDLFVDYLNDGFNAA